MHAGAERPEQSGKATAGQNWSAQTEKSSCMIDLRFDYTKFLYLLLSSISHAFMFAETGHADCRASQN